MPLERDEAAERARVVTEARSWLGTPYHTNAAVRRAGIDCGMLLVRAYVDAGVLPEFDPRPYPHDWHLHQTAERYLGWVRQYAAELEADARPGPGDLLVWRFGKAFSHGAIVVDYPIAVHAKIGAGCELVDVERAADLVKEYRPRLAFTLWPRPAIAAPAHAEAV